MNRKPSTSLPSPNAPMSGDPDFGLDRLQRRLAVVPDDRQARAHYARLLFERGDLDNAVEQLRQLLQLAPDDSSVHCNLGYLSSRQGNIDDALRHLRCAIELQPDFAEAYCNLGLTLNQACDHAGAEQALRRALDLDPGSAQAWTNLGLALYSQGRLGEAELAVRKAVSLAPMQPDMYSNLGLVLQESLLTEEALQAYATAQRLQPGHHASLSNYQMMLQYLPAVASRRLRDAAAGAVFALVPGACRDTPAGDDRRIRVGLVSADLCSHPIGFFLPLPLRHIDRRRFRLIAYSLGARNDAVTERLKGLVDDWHDLGGCSDRTLLQQVAADAIDVLIDLSGHTAGNRLRLFASRAAPVQLSWLGYFASTGVPQMDGVLLAREQIAEGGQAYFTEPLLPLQANQFCYLAPDYAPPVAEPPALRNGFVTFGSFNNSAKLNDGVIRCWADLLAQVPNSRLLLKWKGLADPVVSRRLHARFALWGISAERVELRDRSDHATMLGEYADIDIALDPFPFSGALTSCEALWMGVPVVTLSQQRPVSRQTRAILCAMGREAWVARTQLQYRHIAAALAADVSSLQRHRAALRDELQRSSETQAALLADSLQMHWQAAARPRCSE